MGIFSPQWTYTGLSGTTMALVGRTMSRRRAAASSGWTVHEPSRPVSQSSSLSSWSRWGKIRSSYAWPKLTLLIIWDWNIMSQFHESWVELTLIHRIAQIHQIGWCETLGSTPDHGLENIHRVANQFVSLLLKIWQFKWKDCVLICDNALFFVFVLLCVKTHNVCGLTIHGPIGMQRRLCVRDTAQPMKNNTCKN